MTQPNPWIKDLPRYIPGKHGTSEHAIILSANENPFGAAPEVIECIKSNAHLLARYPDGEARLLRQSLSEKHNLPYDNIVCGAGSDELISLICQAYLRDGDEALYSEFGFLMYPLAVKACGATIHTIAEDDYQTDIPAILQAISPKTKLLFLANPNNPTGYLIPQDQLEYLVNNIPKHVLCVLDCAYIEYVNDASYRAFIYNLIRHPQIILLQTFSKIYGLAALRMGWMHAPYDVAQYIHQVRGPFNCNQLAILAANTALKCDDFITQVTAHTWQALAHITPLIKTLNFVDRILPSHGNFILVLCHDNAGAEACINFLQDNNCYIRAMHAYNIPNGLRITIGTQDENEQLWQHLQQFDLSMQGII